MANTDGIRAGKAFVELLLRDRSLTRGLRAAQRRLQAFGAGVRSIGLGLAGLGAATLTPLVGAVKHFASAGDLLHKMSLRTGISAESLSELGFAAEQSGADLKAFEQGVRVMQRSINDAERGLTTATDAFGDLGLEWQQLRALSPEQQIKAIADALSEIEDPSKRAALAQQILGRSGTRLLPLLQGGAKGMEELQKQARGLGLTVSTETAADAAHLTDTLNILWRVVKQGAFVIGSALADEVVRLSKMITRVVVTTTDWVRENKALIVGVAKVATGVLLAGGVMLGFAVAVKVAAFSLGILNIALVATKFVLLAVSSPIALVVAALAGLGAAIVYYSGAGGTAVRWLMARFGELRAFVGDVVGGISDALAAGDVALAAEILWASLRVAWLNGAMALQDAWQSLWSGTLAAMEIAASAIEQRWIKAAASMKRTTTNLKAEFDKLHKSAQAVVAEEGAKLLVSGNPNVRESDVRSVLNDADDTLAEDIAKIESNRAAKVDRLNRAEDADLRKAQDLLDTTLGVIGQGREDKLAAAADELRKAREALDASIAEAKEKRANLPEGPGPSLADALDDLNNLDLEGLADKVTVRGTFNAAAIQGLAAGGPEERTAKATEETAKNTRRIIDQILANGGLTFA